MHLLNKQQMEELSDYIIEKAHNTIYYIPNFVTEDEETFLLQQVNAAPKPKWKCLSHRRLQNWGGLPHPKGMIPEKIPEWLNKYCVKISDLGAFNGRMANHVLVNEYLAGQGIMPHLDGPLYFPAVSTISLGSHTLLDFYRPMNDDDVKEKETDAAEDKSAPASAYESRYLGSMLLEPRSLILVRDDMYNTFLHGIAEKEEDLITEDILNLSQTNAQLNATLKRSTRVSLTIRHVPKVLKTKLLFGKGR